MTVERTIFAPTHEGDRTAGVLTAIDHTTSECTGDPVPLVHLDSDDGGAVEVRGFHIDLRKGIERAAPSVGDHLSVTYTGRKPAATRNLVFHSYQVDKRPA